MIDCHTKAAFACAVLTPFANGLPHYGHLVGEDIDYVVVHGGSAL